MSYNELNAAALEMATNLYKIMGLNPSPSIAKRPVNVLISRAAYGDVSAAIIEFEGSPPHLPIMCHLNPRGFVDQFSPIMIARRSIAQTKELLYGRNKITKREKIDIEINQFLKVYFKLTQTTD